jgi:hypothetical protein
VLLFLTFKLLLESNHIHFLALSFFFFPFRQCCLVRFSQRLFFLKKRLPFLIGAASPLLPQNSRHLCIFHAGIVLLDFSSTPLRKQEERRHGTLRNDCVSKTNQINSSILAPISIRIPLVPSDLSSLACRELATVHNRLPFPSCIVLYPWKLPLPSGPVHRVPVLSTFVPTFWKFP